MGGEREQAEKEKVQRPEAGGSLTSSSNKENRDCSSAGRERITGEGSGSAWRCPGVKRALWIPETGLTLRLSEVEATGGLSNRWHELTSAWSAPHWLQEAQQTGGEMRVNRHRRPGRRPSQRPKFK